MTTDKLHDYVVRLRREVNTSIPEWMPDRVNVWFDGYGPCTRCGAEYPRSVADHTPCPGPRSS